ncbi:hypothetical protein [Defluviimonas salinarum]|uniref:NnrT protein n=1 Tax=Defluviimonas salinarum TaxID=2992147 RepID=A0ABT3J8H5_9RHOB|nr:hypothetical protein [Defluviimonas salinarum]MCW3783996.1 hypothetical protein [Defluviimonas salinarum]
MSGTRSPSRTAPAIEGRWPVWKLGLLLYPFAAAAVAINLFMLALMGQAIGLTALSPVTTLWLSLPLGIPATWAAGHWVRHLLDEAAR